MLRINKDSTEKIGYISVESPQRMQNDETPLDIDGNPMAFIGELEHDNLFGTLYLFYSEKYQMISQIFQCT